MSEKSGNLGGLALFGAVMFGIGRCSVADPTPPASAPTALVAPAESNAASMSEPVDVVTPREPEQSGTPVAAFTPATPEQDFPSGSDGPTCGSKRFCREMYSCEEAMHYLNDCGVGRLDGDRDGVPCESIC